MSRTFEIIDQLKAKLEKLQPLKPEYQSKLDKKFRLEFNYNSNHLEGNTLTYGETELLLIFDDTKGNHTLREYEEMKSHDVAYLKIAEWAEENERSLIEQDIKNLNEIILVRPFWKEAITQDGQNTRRLINIGNYKEHPNSVRLANGEIFEYASPTDTPFEMQELIKWYKGEENDNHPVTLAAMLHYKFVRIHPFDDGNGRVSRLLMNYVLLKHGFPPIIIKSEDKQNYLNALHLADIGDYEPFILYIAQQVIRSLELSVKAANGENLDEIGDLEKKLLVLKKKLKLEKQIKVKRSNKIVNELINTSIYSLYIKWLLMLSEFDSFFQSSKINISIDSIPTISQKNHEGLFDKLTLFILRYIKNNEKIHEIEFSSSFQTLRTSINEDVFFGGFFKIDFFDHFFEISYTNSNSKIVKYYDEELREEEMKTIVDSIGNWFYLEIETTIEIEKN